MLKVLNLRLNLGVINDEVRDYKGSKVFMPAYFMGILFSHQTDCFTVSFIWTIPTKYASCCNDIASPNRPKGEKLQYSST